jgi:hypothetical protein
MATRNMRVILVAAIVAALLGGGVATARSLVKGSDIAASAVSSTKIKNSSILGKDIKNGTIPLSKLSSGTQALVRKSGGGSGATGARGATGATGAQGPAGPAGAPGAAGASFDPSKVSAATSQVAGFTPWYDSSSTTVVSFADGGIVIDNGKSGIGGVNLPVARGTSLSSLGSIKYTSAATAGTGDPRAAVLAVEVYTKGGIYQSAGDYTTLYLAPTAGGEVDAFDKANTWVSTRPGAATNTVANGTWEQQLTAIGDRAAQNKAIILNVSLRTFGNAADANASAQAAVSSVTLGLRNAQKPVTYSFVK